MVWQSLGVRKYSTGPDRNSATPRIDFFYRGAVWTSSPGVSATVDDFSHQILELKEVFLLVSNWKWILMSVIVIELIIWVSDHLIFRHLFSRSTLISLGTHTPMPHLSPLSSTLEKAHFCHKVSGFVCLKRNMLIWLWSSFFYWFLRRGQLSVWNNNKELV